MSDEAISTYLNCYRFLKNRNHFMVRLELNFRQINYLLCLGRYNPAENPWIGELELRKIFGDQATTVSEGISKLVKDGYLEKSQDAQDKRRIKIKLTEKGKFAYDRISESLDSLIQHEAIDIPAPIM
ncbi:winged helix DNA-binding protein [Candidatus Woesearchaeota archaeon]|nr:winged helix DNA-binding protein [Candidatus Woesearchaeota archaeon]